MIMSDEFCQGLAIAGAAVGAVGLAVGTTALVRECNDRKVIRSLETRTGVLEARPTFTDAEATILKEEAADLYRRMSAAYNAGNNSGGNNSGGNNGGNNGGSNNGGIFTPEQLAQLTPLLDAAIAKRLNNGGA